MRAVIELIWNGLDADAHKVTVSLQRNVLDGIDGVSVLDDGHGMSPEAAQSNFRWIGGSWKRTTQRLTVKMTAERHTGRLLGTQIVGSRGSAKRIDTQQRPYGIV